MFLVNFADECGKEHENRFNHQNDADAADHELIIEIPHFTSSCLFEKSAFLVN